LNIKAPISFFIYIDTYCIYRHQKTSIFITFIATFDVSSDLFRIVLK